MNHATIPIHAALPAAEGCGGCAPGGQGTGCAATTLAPAVTHTTLHGPADEVQRLLQALAQRLDFPPDAPQRGGLMALRINPGEVELRLSGLHGCAAHHAQADLAFQTLRAVLPDTDIYVTLG